MTDIKTRLERKNEEDVLEVGRIIKNAYEGQFGAVLLAIIEANKSQMLQHNLDNPIDRMPIKADRILGRLEGLEMIITSLEMAIKEAEELQKHVEEEDEDAL